MQLGFLCLIAACLPQFCELTSIRRDPLSAESIRKPDALPRQKRGSGLQAVVSDCPDGGDDVVYQSDGVFMLDGSASTPDTDPIISWEFAQSSGVSTLTLLGSPTSPVWFITGIDDLDLSDYYSVTLTVTDDQGFTSSFECMMYFYDDISPKADMNCPDEVNLSDGEFTVDGSRSSDNDIVWFYELNYLAGGDGPPYAYVSSQRPSALVLEFSFNDTFPPGLYAFTLLIKDNFENMDDAVCAILFVDDVSPIAIANCPPSVWIWSRSFEVDGSSSTDNSKVASWTWSSSDGFVIEPGCDLSNAVVSEIVCVDLGRVYTFTLTVSDEAGNTDTATCDVTFQNHSGRSRTRQCRGQSDTNNAPPAGAGSSDEGGGSS